MSEKLKAANKKADEKVDPLIRWVSDSPFSAVIIALIIVGLVAFGAFLAW